MRAAAVAVEVEAGAETECAIKAIKTEQRSNGATEQRSNGATARPGARIDWNCILLLLSLQL